VHAIRQCRRPAQASRTYECIFNYLRRAQQQSHLETLNLLFEVTSVVPAIGISNVNSKAPRCAQAYRVPSLAYGKNALLCLRLDPVKCLTQIAQILDTSGPPCCARRTKLRRSAGMIRLHVKAAGLRDAIVCFLTLKGFVTRQAARVMTCKYVLGLRSPWLQCK